MQEVSWELENLQSISDLIVSAAGMLKGNYFSNYFSRIVFLNIQMQMHTWGTMYM